MKKLSIKLKVSLWYTLIIALISMIALLAMLSVSNKIIVQDAKEKIVRSVDNMANPPEQPQDDYERKPDFRFFEQGVHMAVFDDTHTSIAGFVPFEFVNEIELTDRNLLDTQYNGERYLTYVRKSANPDGNTVWIVGVISIANESSMLSSVAKTNLILIAILIIVAGIGGYLIILSSFKPVDKISKTAKKISESSDLSQRIALGNGNDEIYRLAYTFDEMLDKIEKTLDNEKQFTSDASHELRTPVAVITSECEYVLDCADSLEDAKESVSSIKMQADKMSKLISELLTISRMDKNMQKVNFECIDISELLSFVCDEQEEINGSDIKLIRSIQPSVHANADHILIARLFINLISNAYQYGKDGGKIMVTLEETDENIVFSVADTGIGIAEEHLPKIWERFYQVDSSRTNENGSMGLGLAMVKWIAECHGGTITVNSRLNKGTTFTFVMPKTSSNP